MSTTAKQDDDTNKKPEFYRLHINKLPDNLFDADVPVEKWLDLCESTTNPKGFDCLNEVHPIEWDVHLERIIGITLYMLMNVLPFLILPLVLLYFFGPQPYSQYLVYFIAGYTATLAFLATFVFQPMFLKKYNQSSGWMEASKMDFKRNQYVYTEHNTCKYLSTSMVWGKSIHPPTLARTPVLFCVVPHGVVPFGVTAYPFWSKVWNDKVCRWTTAPVVLQIPIVGYLIRKIGYIPAKAPAILKTLQEKQQNVGVILDGIAGMFHQSSEIETAVLKQRKGIVKIALKAGVPIIPVYAFGHTAVYKVVVDPFGIMEKISIALQTSFTPFFGRWGWLLGPPRRDVPITMCLGNPINCPLTANPSQEIIDEYHTKMLAGYQEVFDQHKTAYGWSHKKLHFV